jgi:hypothetical protein
MREAPACQAAAERFAFIPMKTPSLSLLAALVLTSMAVADDYPVSVERLPAPVKESVEEYLPGAEIVSATMDEDDDRRELEMRVDYRGLLLRVETRTDGSMREIDLDRGYRGLAALLGREASLESIGPGRLPSDVRAALMDFFPESDIVAAAEGLNDGEKFYRSRLRHRALVLRIDIDENGRLLDIDTVR